MNALESHAAKGPPHGQSLPASQPEHAAQPSPTFRLCKPAWIVVCRHNRDFNLGQAAVLKRQFERHAGQDWDFLCLTDRPSEDWHLPLTTNWPGWWAILESFHLTSQPHVLTGLDTLLYGDVRPILRLAESCPPSVLYGIRDLGKPAQWASGVTVWNGDWSFLADRFDPMAHPRQFRGNQEYTAWAVGREPGRHLCYLQDKVDGIVSYKFHLLGKYAEPPARTRVVCFHGTPRPWNVGNDEAAWVGAFLQQHGWMEEPDSRINGARISRERLKPDNQHQLAEPAAPSQMTMHTENHLLRLKAVLWERDQEQVLAALNGDDASGLRLRARHASGLLELRDPVRPAELAETLRRHGVDLGCSLDLEFLPNEAIPRRAQGESDAAEITVEENGGGMQSGPLDGQAVEAPTAAGVSVCAAENWAGMPSSPPIPTRLPPMLFRADGGVVDLADLYRGQTLFLVLNGGSLKDFDFDRLKQPGICSFGVNNGAHGFRPQFWTCVDEPTRFLDSIWRDPGILKFVPQAHFDKPVWDVQQDVLSNWKVRDFPNVLGYRRNERFQAAQWLHEGTFNWGNHADYGGGRSVMLVALRLAYLLGFRKVHLLGCDFRMDEQNRYWFDEERTPASIRNNTNSYRILAGYFEQLKPCFDRAGFQVFNCNPDSHLKVFPFADLNTALDQARVSTAGGTRGMYADRFKAPALPKEECREFLEPLLAGVNGAEVHTDPFVHIRLNSLFPEPVYRELLAHLPENRHYHELRHADAIQPDGKSARLRFTFSDKEMASLPPKQRAFWQRVLLALRDPSLEQAFRDKLKAGLNERFRDSLSEVTLRPVPELIRDLTGYRIGAHTDIFKKVITTQFYLPEDESQEPLGTTFYRKDSNGKTHPANRMPFLPATGYAFAVNARSWHGVETLPTQPKPRNSLMLTYYLGKKGPGG